jgi:membrane fusion protein (multidrug efflux system)
VYTVQDGKAQKVPVELGIRSDGLIEITKGLSGTDPVIVSGKDLVTDGVKVAPTPMDVPAKPAPSAPPAP